MIEQAPAPAAVRARPTLPAPVAFGLQLSIVVSLLAGSIAPTPLYATYREAWGFGATTTTVVFAVYALGVLSALLVAGRLSDHVGRRPVLLGALAIQPVVMILFATADGVGTLLVARLLQGLSTGAAIGAVGAGLVDLFRDKGATANAVAAPAGTAFGSLLAGVLVAYGPSPEQLVYELLLVVFVVQAVGVLAMRETASRVPGALASLRPRFGAPAGVRPRLAAAIPALIASWAIAGFYASLGPAVVGRVTGSASVLVDQLGLVVMAGLAAVVTILARHASPELVMRRGTIALAVGVALTLPAIAAESPVLFFAGAVVAGLGFGGAMSGAMRSVIPFVALHERAGVVSILFVASYTAMGLPAIASGIVLTQTGDLVATAVALGGFAILAALGALALERRRRPA